MKERLQGFWDAVKSLWERLSRIARIILLCSIVGVIGVAILLAVLLNQKEYVLLANDLSPSEHLQVATVLTEQGINYNVEPSGAITVLDTDLDRARMQMVTAGLPANAFDTTYSPGLTATQQDKDYQQNEALQKRLQATIETFDEVKQAVVTINQPEQNSFALQTEVLPPSASITIERRQQRELSPEQLQGIVNIVRDAVPGLEEDRISLTDTVSGDLKTSLSAAGSDANNAKLQLADEASATLRNRAMSMLGKMFGSENVVAEFNVELDTDERVTETQTYNPLDPENPERNPLDFGEHDRQFVGDAPGIVEGVPGANDNVGTPEYGEEVDQNAGLDNYNVHDTYDYLVGSTKEQIKKSGMTILDASGSVLINSRELAAGQRDQIAALVSDATGVGVENITVLNYAFHTGPEMEEVTPISRMSTSQILLLALAALIALVILIVTIIIIVTKRKKEQEEENEDEELLYDEDGNPLLDLDGEDEFEPITLIETQEQKLRGQIKELADSDPEIVAQLLKTWISSG